MQVPDYVRTQKREWRFNIDHQIELIDVAPHRGHRQMEVQPATSNRVSDGHLLTVDADTVRCSRLYVVFRKASHSEHVATWAHVAVAVDNVHHRRDPELVQHSRPPPNREGTIAEIDDLLKLPAEWAGLGSVPPSRDLVDTARKFIQLLPAAMPSPQVTASDDGDIGLILIRSGKKVEVLLDQNTMLAWVAKIPPNRQAGSEHWTGEIPAKLLQWLRVIHA
jgi:hypothetical protein